MAGIGFELNRLAKRDDLTGIVGALVHSAFATTGPWLFTVIALALITLLYQASGVGVDSSLEMMHFRGIIAYNFSFSLVIAAPIFLVITRYMADQIHAKDVTSTPAVMFESLMLIYLLQLPVAIFFYVMHFNLPIELRIAGFVNMYLIISVWLLSVFLSALKDYVSVSWAFLGGLVVAVLASWALSDDYHATGMMIGVNCGLGVTVFWLMARILSEYPYALSPNFSLKPYFKRYWELLLAGLFYNAAIWVDKWIMWFAPEATILESNLRFYPDYDNAMYLAYLTLVPSFAIFVFNVETQFFHHYRRFYRTIIEHGSMKQIRKFHKAISNSVFEGTRNLLLIQGAICLVTILLAPQLFDAIDNFFMQLGIFRLGVLGAFFHGLMLFATVILQYFDCRKPIMWLYGYFFASNALFTLAVMWFAGFEFYGYGYFLSALTSFTLSAMVLFSHLRNLPYHAFITNNTSVRSEVETTATERYEEVYG